MALAVDHFVNTTNLKVNPADKDKIVAGVFLTIKNDGLVTVAAAADPIVGVAGGSGGDATGVKQNLSEDNLVVSGSGAKRPTTNRIYENRDETTASGEVTVYFNGGQFATDVFETRNEADNADLAAYAPGDKLYVSKNGKLSKDVALKANGVVAVALTGVADYPSGIPGTDVDNDISFGKFITYQLK